MRTGYKTAVLFFLKPEMLIGMVEVSIRQKMHLLEPLSLYSKLRQSRSFDAKAQRGQKTSNYYTDPIIGP